MPMSATYHLALYHFNAGRYNWTHDSFRDWEVLWGVERVAIIEAWEW